MQHGPNPHLGGAAGSGRGDVPRYSETLVERIATIISKMNGIAMSLVNNPERISSPTTISRHATKSAVKCGSGIPVL
jgi:hypothetical protein